ncbi:EI24 domain-containing protein [Campylobacter fetus]|nr:EI24 domain-containing protein [Campylobacter fetus]EAI5945920.1 EI24 domain-containing protein [Campylobacter fetus]EAJ0318483.1 EI24 domain-containing protein [Campylobacter fetus]EAJ0345545.1 EI24 domain-containing protein [Campylobacter fetus]EAJ1238914.1 EI24 domain-containing protein [Campylobacter fetus]
MINIINLCIGDFFKKKFILLSLLPTVFSVIVFSSLIIFGGSELLIALKNLASNGEFLDKDGIVATILSFSIVKALILSSFYIFSGFFVIILSSALAGIIAGFLTPIVTKYVNKKYYNINIDSEVTTSRVIKISIITFLKFIAILLICIPFLFVPFLNLFIINLPFFYLFYKFMLIDVASNCMDKTMFEITMIKGAGLGFALSAILFYLLCLIPFIGLFFQLFFVMFFTHLLFKKNQNQ